MLAQHAVNREVVGMLRIETAPYPIVRTRSTLPSKAQPFSDLQAVRHRIMEVGLLERCQRPGHITLSCPMRLAARKSRGRMRSSTS